MARATSPCRYRFPLQEDGGIGVGGPPTMSSTTRMRSLSGTAGRDSGPVAESAAIASLGRRTGSVALGQGRLEGRSWGSGGDGFTRKA